jgi:DNA-3-methyladenine glycosylase
MHFCANVVTEKVGMGRAVLLRGIEPVMGMERMYRNRGLSKKTDPALLCSGPARLCEAFGIGRNENGTDLCEDSLWIARGQSPKSNNKSIARSTRIGFLNGTTHRWRFFLKGNDHVSPGRASRKDIH